MAPASVDFILISIGIFAGIVVFAVVVATILLKNTSLLRLKPRQAADRIRALEHELAMARAMMVAEPQIVVKLEGEADGEIIANTLDPATSLPGTAKDLLDPQNWCPAEPADDLAGLLSALRRDGAGFNRVVNAGMDGDAPALDVDGWISGGDAFVRIRPLRNYGEAISDILAARDKARRAISAQRALLDVLPMPVWFCARDGRLAWVNQSYAAAVEAVSRDEVTLEQVQFLEERQRYDVAAAVQSGEVYQEKLRVIVGGTRRTFDIIAVPSPGGGFAVIAVDVEAIESARGALDRHMAAHARTLDRVTTAVAIFGPDQRLGFFNKAFLDLWGLDADWLQGQPKHGEILDRLRARSLLPEQADYSKWKAQLLEYDGTEEDLERWWHLPDGRTIFVIVEYTEDGGVTFLYENVTEQLALQSGYNELINVQRETLDHLRDGVAVFAASGRLKLVNPAFAEMWKLSPSMLEEEPRIDEVIAACRPLYDGEEVWREIKAGITAIEDAREPFSGQMTRRDDSIIAYAGLPLPDGAMMLTSADVTDVELAERALREKNEALETADKVKSGFISNVSYELRTPLTNIIGFSDMLMNPALGELTGKQREYMRDIKSSSATLLAIINDILDLATLDAGALELNLSRVRAMPMIEAAVLGVRERLVRDKIILDIQVEPEDLSFMADGQRLTQILFNLLSNAIGFSPAGSVIHVRCARDGAAIRLQVIDHGQGIPENYRKAVFDRFESDSRGSRHRGAGLGLSIVKDLVGLHGGTVAIEPGETDGTAVTITLPENGHKIAGIREGTTRPANAPLEETG